MEEWSEDKEDPATQAGKCLEQSFGDRQEEAILILYLRKESLNRLIEPQE